MSNDRQLTSAYPSLVMPLDENDDSFLKLNNNTSSSSSTSGSVQLLPIDDDIDDSILKLNTNTLSSSSTSNSIDDDIDDDDAVDDEGPLPKKIRLIGNFATDNAVVTSDGNASISGLFSNLLTYQVAPAGPAPHPVALKPEKQGIKRNRATTAALKKDDLRKKHGICVPSAILNAFVKAVNTQALAIICKGNLENRRRQIGILHRLLITLKPIVRGNDIYFVSNNMAKNTVEEYLLNPLNHAAELRTDLLQAQAECLQNCDAIIPQFNNINIPSDILRTINGGFMVWRGRSDVSNNYMEVQPETFSNTALRKQLKEFSEVLKKDGFPEVGYKDVYCISWAESAKARPEKTIDLKDPATFSFNPVSAKGDGYCTDVIGLLFTVCIVSRPEIVLSVEQLNIAQTLWSRALAQAWCIFQVGDRDRNAFDPRSDPIASQVSSVVSSKGYIQLQNSAHAKSNNTIPRPAISSSSDGNDNALLGSNNSTSSSSSTSGSVQLLGNHAAQHGTHISSSILDAFAKAVNTQALAIICEGTSTVDRNNNRNKKISIFNRLLITLKAIGGYHIYFVPKNMPLNIIDEYLSNPLNHAAELRTYLLQAQVEYLQNGLAQIPQFNNINIPNDILRTIDGGCIVWHGQSDIRNNYKDVKQETFSNTTLINQLKDFSAVLNKNGYPEVRQQDVKYISWAQDTKARPEKIIDLKDPATFSFYPVQTGRNGCCINVIGLLFTVCIVARPGVVLSFEQLKYAQTLWSRTLAQAWCMFQVGNRDRDAFDPMQDPIASQVFVISSEDYIRFQNGAYIQSNNTIPRPAVSSSSTADLQRVLMVQPTTTNGAPTSVNNNLIITPTTTSISTYTHPGPYYPTAATATNFQPGNRM